MKVKQLQLQNYGRFDNLTMEFAPNGETKGNVTIIVGNNGAGKSQILQALATGFSWFVNGVKDESNGLTIDEQLINNNSNETKITFDVDFGEYDYRNHAGMLEISHWNITKIRDGKIGEFSNYHKELRKVIRNYRQAFTNNDNLSFPLIVFYPIKRSGMAQFINQNPITKSQLEGYTYALDYGLDFNAFFDWFKKLEDIHNERQRDFYREIHRILGSYKDNTNKEILDKLMNDIDATQFKKSGVLNTTILAIEQFTDFKNIRIERKGTPKMVVEKDGEKLDVNQLSQGEKSLLALVGDIARRLAILNPSLDNPLQGEGVVLIDEVDLHLHPKWQQNLIDKLTKTFPNVQFILTTHSPHIVSDRKDVLVYALDDGQLHKFGNVYGEDVNTLLNDVFDVSRFTPEIDKKFNDIRRAISCQELDNAESLIDNLAQEVSPNHTELLKMRLMLAQAKLTLNQAD